MSNELKQKLIQLTEWMPVIIETVKKDLKNDHLKQDYAFAKKYLDGKNLHKIENEDLSKAYTQALKDEEKGAEIAEFISHRWIFRNSEMYNFFEERLTAINPNFTEIKALSDAQAEPLIKDAVANFGALRTYIFSMLNAVAFSSGELEKLAKQAKTDKVHQEKEALNAAEQRTLEEAKKAHALEISRLTDKYEKKLLGLQKKYTQDVAMLKKQIANLQRKIA